MLLRSARTVDAAAARPTAGRILRHGDHGLGVLDGDRGDVVVVREVSDVVGTIVGFRNVAVDADRPEPPA